jgi:hypothetical protein
VQGKAPTARVHKRNRAIAETLRYSSESTRAPVAARGLLADQLTSRLASPQGVWDTLVLGHTISGTDLGP